MSSSSSNETPPPAPSKVELLFRAQQQLTEIAVACANAVNVVAAQAEVIRIPGLRPQACDPQVFQVGVEQLYRSIVPVEGGGIESDPFAGGKVVRWPGLRPGRGKKRRRIHATSYHRAVINLACELYHLLASVGMEYAEVDCRPYCKGDEFIIWDVPEFHTFATKPWPRDLAKLVLAKAQEADPVFNVERFEAAIEMELKRADEKLLLMRHVLAKRAAGSPPASREESTADRPPSPPTSEASGPATGREEQATVALLSVYTNGIADEKIQKAQGILRSASLTTNAKLTEIDELLRLPPTASAEALGAMCGVSRQAIWKTKWWQENRAGEKESEIGRRKARHADRAKRMEPPGPADE